jgi:uncharacterized membrane protein (DUF4010 family)
MVVRDGVDTDTAWRAILIAAMANLVFKAGIAWTMGGRSLCSRIAPLFAVNLVAGILLLLFWPTEAGSAIASSEAAP